MSALLVGAKSLTLADVEDVALRFKKVSLAPAARKRIERCYRYLQTVVRSGKTIYGVNTGFGPLSDVKVDQKSIDELQVNFLRSHSVGVGSALDERLVRAMLLLRAQSLSYGVSGVQVQTVQRLIDFLNRGVVPVVPIQGSVGASGDLAPLAHMSSVLIGEGEAFYKGRKMSGAQALKKAKLKPIRLGAKEGLALCNGTQFMTAHGVLLLLEAERLAEVADLSGAMSLEAVRASAVAFDSLIHAVRPHKGQVETARRLRQILKSGGESQISKSHHGCGKVQDSYSFRCMPQVHGASRDVFQFVRSVLEKEINSVTDNPLVFPAKKKILSGGNFHGQVLALALDALTLAVAELGSISERRVDKLMNPTFSDLPAFLAKEGGKNSGFMIVQYVAASLVSENKTLCHPASADSIPTSNDKEDHVSMGAWGARKCAMVIGNVRKVLAIELLSAAQGIDFLRPLKTSKRLEQVHRWIRDRSKRVDRDRSLSHDISRIEEDLLLLT